VSFLICAARDLVNPAGDGLTHVPARPDYFHSLGKANGEPRSAATPARARSAPNRQRDSPMTRGSGGAGSLQPAGDNILNDVDWITYIFDTMM